MMDTKETHIETPEVPQLRPSARETRLEKMRIKAAQEREDARTYRRLVAHLANDGKETEQEVREAILKSLIMLGY